MPTASLDSLRQRAALLRRLRQFFDARGFLEVETPILSADSVIDRNLDPLSVTLFGDPRQPEIGRRMWLQTSPEFGMKRLLASGATAIYQVTKAFRGGEVGRLHNPEFTMVEWYRVGDDYETGMSFLSELTEQLAGLGIPESLSYREAFLRHAAIDPFTASLRELRAAAIQNGGTPQHDHEDRDEWLNILLATVVEPHLGQSRPTILYDYPATQSALARVRQNADGAAVAERFELYIRGIELANGYHELLDPATLRQRNRQTNAQRAADGKFMLPEESHLLAAMDHGLPPCSGVALGFDRLAMIVTGATTIQQVITFATDRA